VKREKAIRHGHKSTLNVWWARRPLVVSRASVFASVVNAPESEDEKKYLQDFFLVRLCKWETRDEEEGENDILREARARILEAPRENPVSFPSPSLLPSCGPWPSFRLPS